MNVHRKTRIFLAIALGILTILLIAGITVASLPGGLSSIPHIPNSTNAPSTIILVPVFFIVFLILMASIIYLIRRKQPLFERKQPMTILHHPQQYVGSDLSRLTVGFDEEPLKALNLISVISTLTELHTKCWLIEHERYEDFIAYARAHNSRFVEEADLVILSITHNSPTVIDLLLGSATIAMGMKIAIDAVLQTPQRLKAKKLENEKKELDLEKERWDFQQKRLNDSMEAARQVIDVIQPDIDPKIKEKLIHHFLPAYSGVESIKVLAIHLQSPSDQNKVTLRKPESSNGVD